MNEVSINFLAGGLSANAFWLCSMPFGSFIYKFCKLDNAFFKKLNSKFFFFHTHIINRHNKKPVYDTTGY